MHAVERDPARLFAPPTVQLERRADGSLLLRSAHPLGQPERCIGQWLVHWARAAPQRPFLLERSAGTGAWQSVSYGETLERVQRIGAWLLRAGLSRERPLAILSDNGIEHALLALGAMHVGVPVAPVSPAYSLLSHDFAKLRAIIALLEPGVIYVADAGRFAAALAAIGERHDAHIVVGGDGLAPAAASTFGELLDTADEPAVARAFAGVGPDTVAKLLFTSGSTGEPKAVINTQRMLCVNQQQIRAVWPFLDAHAPVVVDWLPWSHTFGGNHNFNMILRSGGTLYIDAGRPAPGLFERTVANLREVAPSLYFNVPRGYELLAAALRADPALRERFFSRLQILFYAAAALPQHLWEALEALWRETTGGPAVLVSAWGSTETAPLATSCHFQAERSGVIGLPVPGCELKLVPSGEKLEVRVRGPNVTPGYWKRPQLTASHFDAEGFYCIGDAVRFVDPERPERGLLFDGRVSEDFKLDSGTWVSVGMLRVRALEALAPLAQDIVVAGADRAAIGLLIFPSVPACRALCAELPAEAPLEQVLAHAAVRERIRAGLERLKEQSGGTSSMYAARALLLAEPPSIDAGEITDKGYINQRAVLARRAALVQTLYASPADPAVIALRT